MKKAQVKYYKVQKYKKPNYQQLIFWQLLEPM
jgi:hypothetical protein